MPAATLVDTTMHGQIRALNVGESYARAVRFDGNAGGLKSKLSDVLRTLRSSIQPTVYRIQEELNRQYTIEQVEGRTSSKDEIIVIVVTRLA